MHYSSPSIVAIESWPALRLGRISPGSWQRLDLAIARVKKGNQRVVFKEMLKTEAQFEAQCDAQFLVGSKGEWAKLAPAGPQLVESRQAGH
jgi:hypothetical protein